VSSRAVAVPAEPFPRANGPKDNWLGFVGDVLKFTGEVQFRSMLRIDGHRVEFVGKGVAAHRKAGWMVRARA